MGSRLLLASASPRRQDLLRALDVVFDVRACDVDERAAAGALPPAAAAVAVALAKARAANDAAGVVLAADTMVVLDGTILGKPEDAADARRMLRVLRARPHVVVTGVALRTGEAERFAVVESRVHMRRYGDDEIEAYVAAGGGRDKAGAYGIQDAGFTPVERIDGCWCNVMGLPLWTADGLLRAAGVAVPRRPDQAFDRCVACPAREGVA